GMKQTRIMLRVGSDGESKEGKVNQSKLYSLGATTPHEMVKIMEKLDRSEVISHAASLEMLDLMKREHARYAIGRTTSDPMASKYGALDRLRSCVAIVYTKKAKMAMAITVDE